MCCPKSPNVPTFFGEKFCGCEIRSAIIVSLFYIRQIFWQKTFPNPPKSPIELLMVLFSSFLGLFGFKWIPKGYQKVPPRPHLNLSTSQKEYGCIQAHFLANLVHSSSVKWTPMVTHRSHYVSTWVTQPLTRKMAVLSPFPSRFESFSGQMDPNSSSGVIPPLKTKMALFSTFGVK